MDMALYVCILSMCMQFLLYFYILYICIFIFSIIHYSRKERRAGQEKGRWAVYGETCSICDMCVCVYVNENKKIRK